MVKETTRERNQDLPVLLQGEQTYEVGYEAKKTGKSRKRVKRAVENNAWMTPRATALPRKRHRLVPMTPFVRAEQEPSAGSASLLVLLQIPAGRDRRLERAVVLLRLVLELDLREVERELVGRQVVRAVGAAGLIRADDEVLHRNHVVVLLVFALLADEQLRLLDVLAGRAGEHQLGARLAHLGREVEVLEVNLAGAGAAAVPGRTVVGVAPGEALELDRVRMLAVLGFTFDAFNFQKIVGSHWPFLSALFAASE